MLEIKHRKNIDGVDCVAPFINGWNVWGIPEKEWTEAVQKAVLNAYQIGWNHAMAHISEKAERLYIPKDWDSAAMREGE